MEVLQPKTLTIADTYHEKLKRDSSLEARVDSLTKETYELKSLVKSSASATSQKRIGNPAKKAYVTT